MTKLKFTGRSDDTEARDSFPFPGSIRDLLSRADPRAISPMDLAASMGQTLDRMQLKLSELRRELDGDYRIGSADAVDNGHRPAA
ncbi:MAG: hypothetical protein IBJ10_09545 [Phycisphaerales bacterium]|nr:hypothetical protein [Phycisphaerales bacterium]